MALNENVLVTEQYLQDIADAIRAKIAQAGVISIYDGTVETSGGAITDLTGTSWYFNETIDVSSAFNYSINFTYIDAAGESDDGTGLYLDLDMRYGPGVQLYYLPNTAGGRYAVIAGGWRSENERTISITGGADVQNANLIAWLEANATLTGGGVAT